MRVPGAVRRLLLAPWHPAGLLAALSGRGWAAAAFAGALGLSLLAAGTLGLLSTGSLRSLRDELAPPTSMSVRGPLPCQEHSGGDTRGPGG